MSRLLKIDNVKKYFALIVAEYFYGCGFDEMRDSSSKKTIENC